VPSCPVARFLSSTRATSTAWSASTSSWASRSSFACLPRAKLATWGFGAAPRELIGVEVGEHPRFELFVYVDDVDRCVEQLQATGAAVLRDPEDMFWGERVGYVADPEGNPVALAAAQHAP